MSAREMREYDRLIIRTPKHTQKHLFCLHVNKYSHDRSLTPQSPLTGLDDIVSQADDERVRPICLKLLPKLLQHLVKLGQVTGSHSYTEETIIITDRNLILLTIQNNFNQ